MRKRALAAAFLAAVLIPLLSLADVGPPAHLQISEREPGQYVVRWRVPRVLPPRAVPVPDLPETCAAEGDVSVATQAGAWLFSQDWRCESTLAGQAVGLDYPFLDLALTTVVRVDLLSGDRFAHVITAGEEAWQLPEGTAAPDLILGARKAVASGASHVMGSWIHLVFLLVLGLMGGWRSSIRLVSGFSLGQVAGVVVASAVGVGLGAVPAEFALAVSVVLLAREMLRPPEQRRRLPELAALAGAVHGVGLAALLAGSPVGAEAGFVSQLITIIGMDAAHLTGAAAVAALVGLLARQLTPVARKGAVYATGVIGMALAVGLAVSGGAAEAGTPSLALQAPVQGAASRTAGVPGSQRIAPTTSNATVQSFLAVEPFEVRHEVMIRIGQLYNVLELDLEAEIGVAEQPALLDRLTRLVLDGALVEVDGAAPEPVVRRADFMTVDPTGALPRANPVTERVSGAIVGVVAAYPLSGMAERATLTWRLFPGSDQAVAATIIDPETVESATLTLEAPTIAWENNLLEDPIPTIEEVEVEPTWLPLPLLSLPLALLAAVLLVAGLRDRRVLRLGPEVAIGMSRVVLALAFLVGPIAQTALAVPGSAGRTPSERQARRVLSGLLPNIYRALEFRDEAAIYDRLAVSVVGETLTEVYLEQRRALELEERGGAQARVEAVEVLEASDIESRDDGFAVRAAWTVGGMVTHFGHRHFRQNRYDAVIEIVPVEGVWRIQSLEVLDQERVR